MSRNPMGLPAVGEKWRYRQNRGTGTFHVTFVSGDRVTLRGVASSRHKTISLKTLRGDYERAS